MAYNNTSRVSTNKKNLKRTNHLKDNGKFSTFDNGAFEEEEEDATTFCERNDNNGLTKTPNRTSQGRESIELKDNTKPNQQKNRRVLGSVNVNRPPNLQLTDTTTNDNKTTKDTSFKSEKPSKLSLLGNLKRFDVYPQLATEQPERLRKTRQSLTEDFTTSEDSVDGPTKFTRSASVRIGKPGRKPQRLLRDISFSDADDSVTKNYGSLKNINLPRRGGKGPVSVDTVVILESLMRELINRGKVHHVAVLDIEECGIIASLPCGMLSEVEAKGIVKSITPQSSIFKLKIGDVEYSCFSHRQDAVQGRAPDLVMVMQMTETCVVVGFSRDSAPGSCNSEVHEFTKVLEEAGW